ncbi:MAG TPA: cation transporter [Candidatus Sulfotelmatobacter sp.]|jgi:divalent metal cation (Fe/Co/Zn/Cd) transporter|nr:cation transporter [Candidatus Sulfotelmatobacter sp.]
MLHKKALFYEYLTIAWNVLEGLICVTIGLLSGSIALFAYGLESGIEVFSSSVVVWDLNGKGKGRTQVALKLISFAYLIVSLYIFIDASLSLIAHHHPQKSLLGIIFIILTVIIMVALGLIKKRIGTKMRSRTVLADAKFTLIDGALAGAVLVGLVLNALFGWWWVDEVMALILAGVAFREGYTNLCSSYEIL